MASYLIKANTSASKTAIKVNVQNAQSVKKTDDTFAIANRQSII